jgi:multidrug resistance protein
MDSVSDSQQEDTGVASPAAMTTAPAVGENDAYKNAAEEKTLSIYDIHTKSKKNLVLLILSLLGFLSTFDEVIYLPALSQIIKGFNTTETVGSITVSLYLFTISFSSLIWGALLDYYRRKPPTIIGLGAFILFSAGCYVSSNIYVFLACRALQGCTISVTLVVGQATIADMFQPDYRGRAYGIFFAFYFSAVFLGPTIGGILSEYYGWRSTFLTVTIISFILLICYVLIVPETKQYDVICMYRNQRKITLLEADQVSPPKLTNPCSPLFYLSDATILPYAFVLLCGFIAANCGCLVASIELAKTPYSYRESIIGILYIPLGVAVLSGSLIGGKVSDQIANKSFLVSKILEGRIVPGLIFSILAPVGLIIFGWALQYGVNVSVLILGQILFGFGVGAIRPGIMSYFTIKYQEHAASINSANTFLQQIVTSIVLTFIGQGVQAINTGWFFTIIAVCNILTTVIAAVIICRKIILSKNPEKKLLL